MACWIECRKTDERATKIWVNMDLVIYTNPMRFGTELRYPGGDNNHFSVREAQSEIMQKIEDSKA